MMPNDEHKLEGDAVVESLVQIGEVVLDDELWVVDVDDRQSKVVDDECFHRNLVELVVD